MRCWLLRPRFWEIEVGFVPENDVLVDIRMLKISIQWHKPQINPRFVSQITL